MTKFAALRFPSARTYSVIAGTVTLSLAAVAMAGQRGPEFPVSVADAKNRAEARFQELDADGSGEISPAELAAAPKPLRLGHGPSHRHMHGKDAGTSASAGEHGGKWRGTGGAVDADLFERLDEDGDGLLSKAEFDASKIREARRESMQEWVFARLDRDGSGGISRDELPDMSRRLEAMDADGDGTVTREEARAHHMSRRDEKG